MARKTEQNDSADPGGFHEFASPNKVGPAGTLAPLEPGVLPDMAAEEKSQDNCDDESGKPPTGPQP